MSDDDRIDQALSLLAKPGAYEVLHTLYARGGAATYAQIGTGARPALALLRALAAEGFVISYRCGSLDIEPTAMTSFSLTMKGQAVAGHLARLREWMAARSSRPGSQPASH